MNGLRDAALSLRTIADLAGGTAHLMTIDEIRGYANSRATVAEEILAGGPTDSRSILADVMAELARATAKFPTWPTDPLHAVAVLGEESGELTRAVMQAVYEPHKGGREQVREEAVQTAAMALRFLMSLDEYEYAPGVQHEQLELSL
ncbi:hypothetical protein CSC62_07400 [Pseudoxanthomonas jiangsuensis]|uniref:hypothetical protein n=1 Tax=Pseudoxanthomonas jiangsuensis TaxID=619688 RepID=UPI0013919265|nr:hypothetical protein [Pseudoxanthomonas jiangsuensis]KAF1697964.1 hypothetical protein CSC62_07400 [Pseudoxanthomonas jiangsuensis]